VIINGPSRPVVAEKISLPHSVGLSLIRAIANFWIHGDLFSGASISFYALFSMLPIAVLLVIGVHAAFPGGATERMIARLFGGNPNTDIITQTIQEAYDQRQSLGWAGGLTLLIAATGVFAAVQVALDRIWDSGGRLFTHRLGIGVLIMMASLLIFIGTLIGTIMALRLARLLGLGLLIEPRPPITHGVRPVLAITTMLAQFGIFWTGYRFLPSVPVRWRDAWPGALVGTVVWQITDQILGWYILRFSDYGSLYHSLGIIVALITWVYALSCTFLFGAEFVAQWMSVTKRPTVEPHIEPAPREIRGSFREESGARG
jgi:membrane protein